MHIQKMMLFAKRFNAVSFLVCFLVSFSISIFAGYHLALPLSPPLLVEQGNCSKTIAGVFSANASFQTLSKALDTAGLKQMLSCNSKDKDLYTIFAPTEDAFKSSKQGLNWWRDSKNEDVKKKILEYHIVKGSLKLGELKSELKTLEGNSVKIQHIKGRIQVEKAEIDKHDIKASNGVIYKIKKVICPPNMKC
jgi:uncharacterized surface protein with fasciclin (FAS1) repeats